MLLLIQKDLCAAVMELFLNGPRGELCWDVVLKQAFMCFRLYLLANRCQLGPRPITLIMLCLLLLG